MRVGNYELLARLGEGGMGVVHLARAEDGRRVALKVIRPNVIADDESRARLAREVNSLSRVRSHRVAEIIDADPWGPVPYVATRYVPGWSLHDHVEQEGPMEVDDLTWTGRCLAEALAAVHAAGVLHRDVKPSNVLMEGRSPVLIDFGLARVADDNRITAEGWLLGTPGYLAPEILHGAEASAASDIHSWGATVAYAATGRAPFGRGPSAAVMDRVRRGEHDLSGVPEPVLEVVEAALDPEPRNRPTLAALLAWLDPDEALTTAMPRPAAPAPEPVVDFVPVPETRPYDDGEWWAESYLNQVEGTRRMPVEAPPAPDWGDTVQVLDADAARREGIEQDDEGEPREDQVPLRAPQPRAGFAERTRRALLMLALVAMVGTATSIAPYVVAGFLAVGVWLLRAGSLTGSALVQRRAARGRKWYDGVQTPLSSPWHVLRAIPGTLVLLLWAAGLGTVVALVCFALSAPIAPSLALIGAAAAFGAWIGPGAGRVRRPVRRAVRPLAARGWVWLLALVALGAVLWLLAGPTLLDSTGQVDWSPAGEAPWRGLRG